jgi:NAD(P)H-flavin reductase
MEDMEESVAEISIQLFHVLRGFYAAGQYFELWNVGQP